MRRERRVAPDRPALRTRETAAAPEPVIGDALERTQSRSKQRTLQGTSGRRFVGGPSILVHSSVANRSHNEAALATPAIPMRQYSTLDPLHSRQEPFCRRGTKALEHLPTGWNGPNASRRLSLPSYTETQKPANAHAAGPYSDSGLFRCHARCLAVSASLRETSMSAPAGLGRPRAPSSARRRTHGKSCVL